LVTRAGLRKLGGPTRSPGLGRLTLRPHSVVRARSPDWVEQTRSHGLVGSCNSRRTCRVAQAGLCGPGRMGGVVELGRAGLGRAG
jgi:hypothetical protein